LIIDRQRNADNVYLLNAVTEEDLISLAQAGGREVSPNGTNNNVSAIPVPEQPNEPNQPNQPNQQQPSEPGSTDSTNDVPAAQPVKNDNSMFIIVGIAVLAVGGAGYYFKIVRPKQNSVYEDDNEEEDKYGYEDESDDNSDDEDGDER
jgi:hypothetical protein